MAGSASIFRLTPLAEMDLEDIWAYTVEAWSHEQAENYHADLLKALARLAAGTAAGRIAGVREGYFKYAVGSHLVFYRRSEVGIDVIRMLHQPMDAGRHL